LFFNIKIASRTPWLSGGMGLTERSNEDVHIYKQSLHSNINVFIQAIWLE
jgi:hypothetical protein